MLLSLRGIAVSCLLTSALAAIKLCGYNDLVWIVVALPSIIMLTLLIAVLSVSRVLSFRTGH